MAINRYDWTDTYKNGQEENMDLQYVVGYISVLTDFMHNFPWFESNNKTNIFQRNSETGHIAIPLVGEWIRPLRELDH